MDWAAAGTLSCLNRVAEAQAHLKAVLFRIKIEQAAFRKIVLIQDLLDEVARWVCATVKSVVVPELGRPLAFVSPVPDGSHSA